MKEKKTLEILQDMRYSAMTDESRKKAQEKIDLYFMPVEKRKKKEKKKKIYMEEEDNDFLDF